ncbi:MAG: InlB B-repeat-containing protein [Johnsonella sp.]|nr:InlB B-repeat-containing protein [Johnsonella sp.]
MKTRIKTGITALLFVVLFALQAHAYIGDMHAVPRDWMNFPNDGASLTIKKDIPVRYHFNGGVYTDREGNTYTDYIEVKTDELGSLSSRHYAYIPKRDGYVWVGWSRVKDVLNKETACFSDTIYEQKISWNSDITPIDLYACWAEDKSASGCYIINFFPTGGGKVEPVFLYTDAEGKLPYYPIPEREGYRFKGWSDSWGAFIGESGLDENTVYKSNMELFSHWEDENANKIKITFDPNGGTVQPTEMMIEKGSKIQPMPVPEREGYTFRFWEITAALFGDDYNSSINENTVFYDNTMLFAHWKEKSAGKWEMISDKWAYKNEGSFLRSIWKEINGSWYYFDENAKMKTGWFNQGGNWYYLSEKADANQGKMLTGWQQINGSWYYFYPNSSSGKPAGSMASDISIGGWKLDTSGKWIP